MGSQWEGNSHCHVRVPLLSGPKLWAWSWQGWLSLLSRLSLGLSALCSGAWACLASCLTLSHSPECWSCGGFLVCNTCYIRVCVCVCVYLLLLNLLKQNILNFSQDKIFPAWNCCIFKYANSMFIIAELFCIFIEMFNRIHACLAHLFKLWSFYQKSLFVAYTWDYESSFSPKTVGFLCSLSD